MIVNSFTGLLSSCNFSHRLWREKCREYEVDIGLGEASTLAIPSEERDLTETEIVCRDVPHKKLFLKQYKVEMNWRYKPVRAPKHLKGHDDHVITCLQFDGKKIVSGSDDNTLKVWSAITGNIIRTLVGHTGKCSKPYKCYSLLAIFITLMLYFLIVMEASYSIVKSIWHFKIVISSFVLLRQVVSCLKQRIDMLFQLENISTRSLMVTLFN